MADAEGVRRAALALPRAIERMVQGRVKFNVGRIVFVALSEDQTVMGFGFPREERAALVASYPDKFLMPVPSDLRYQWVRVRLDAVDADELGELIENSWRMCVSKKAAAEYDALRGSDSEGGE